MERNIHRHITKTPPSKESVYASFCIWIAFEVILNSYRVRRTNIYKRAFWFKKFWYQIPGITMVSIVLEKMKTFQGHIVHVFQTLAQIFPVLSIFLHASNIWWLVRVGNNEFHLASCLLFHREFYLASCLLFPLVLVNVVCNNLLKWRFEFCLSMDIFGISILLDFFLILSSQRQVH